MKRIIIDTDPGLDDAVALLWAFGRQEFTVEAITTVAGNIGLDLTSRNALRLLALEGKDIPVIPGAAAPLHRQGFNEVRIHGADGLGGVNLPEPKAEAVNAFAPDWLAAKLRAEPAGSIELHCLGPLTNLAMLIKADPEAAARLSRVVIMGGALRERGNVGPRSEFNFAHDPEALGIVLAAGLDLTIVPLDVTRKVRADAAWLDRLGRSPRPQAHAVRDLVAAYFDATTDAARPESRPLHDPCVPVIALYPQHFTVEHLGLAADTSTGPDAGALSEGPHQVKIATGVDGAAVVELLAQGLE